MTIAVDTARAGTNLDMVGRDPRLVTAIIATVVIGRRRCRHLELTLLSPVRPTPTLCSPTQRHNLTPREHLRRHQMVRRAVVVGMHTPDRTASGHESADTALDTSTPGSPLDDGLTEDTAVIAAIHVAVDTTASIAVSAVEALLVRTVAA
jgi:hypothetical protein